MAYAGSLRAFAKGGQRAELKTNFATCWEVSCSSCSHTDTTQASGSRQSCPVRPAMRDLDSVRGTASHGEYVWLSHGPLYYGSSTGVHGLAHAACCVIYHNDDHGPPRSNLSASAAASYDICSTSTPRPNLMVRCGWSLVGTCKGVNLPVCMQIDRQAYKQKMQKYVIRVWRRSRDLLFFSHLSTSVERHSLVRRIPCSTMSTGFLQCFDTVGLVIWPVNRPRNDL